MRRSGLVALALCAAAGCGGKEDAVTVEPPENPAPMTGDPAGVGASISALSPPAGTMSMAQINAGVVNFHALNSRIEFVGTHTGDEPDPRTGSFSDYLGKLTVDEAAEKLLSVSVEINTDSLTTSIEKLTDHLKSPDFLDVRQHPTIQFVSTAIDSQDGKAEITGDLTLMGVTKEVRFPASMEFAPGGMTLKAEFPIDRTEFGMAGMTDRVNKEVSLKILVGEGSRPQGGPSLAGAGAGGGGGRGNWDPEAFFKERDQDGDGKLSGDEISERMQQSLEEIDTDGDGAVSLEEFQARMAARRGGGQAASGDQQ